MNHRRLPGPCKKLALVLLGIVLAPVLLEVALQGFAAILWYRHRGDGLDRPDPATGELQRRVLCVGDSYTFGTGASSPSTGSYPARLEVHLNELDAGPARWQVINKGWPGLNSSEVCQRLPGLLLAVKPHYVCILAGLNNRWSDRDADLPPPTLEQTGVVSLDPAAWHWKLRTLDLLALVRDALRPGIPETPGMPERGSAEEPAPPAPSSAGDGRFPMPDSPTAVALLEQLWQMGERISTHQLEHVDQDLIELIPRVQAEHAVQCHEVLIRVLTRARLREQAAACARAAIAEFGPTYGLCGRAIEPLTALGRLEEARVCVNQALALEPEHKDAWLYHALVQFYLTDVDYLKAMRAALEAFRLDGDEPALETTFRRLRFDSMSPEAFEAALERFDLPEATSHVLHELYARVSVPTAKEEQVERLERDLGNMIALVREFGADVVVLTYPVPSQEVYAFAALRDLQREIGCVLEVHPFFEQLPEDRYDEYFVADGHCNDRGYDVMAATIARHLQEIDLRRRR